MEPQKTLDSQSNPALEKGQRNHASGFQTILQSHGNKSSMILTGK